jgi:hypothetical protein
MLTLTFSKSDADCNGLNNGLLKIKAVGVSSDYAYIFSPKSGYFF